MRKLLFLATLIALTSSCFAVPGTHRGPEPAGGIIHSVNLINRITQPTIEFRDDVLNVRVPSDGLTASYNINDLVDMDNYPRHYLIDQSSKERIKEIVKLSLEKVFDMGLYDANIESFRNVVGNISAVQLSAPVLIKSQDSDLASYYITSAIWKDRVIASSRTEITESGELRCNALNLPAVSLLELPTITDNSSAALTAATMRNIQSNYLSTEGNFSQRAERVTIKSNIHVPSFMDYYWHSRDSDKYISSFGAVFRATGKRAIAACGNKRLNHDIVYLVPFNAN